ncbi:tRNA dihydrouridine(20/20a) synthase DusA [Pelagibacterium sp. 26DY04]|uniref:tRNA dihydrouridine(20/20a) synthase DusA n=1 Tax=Pelagibacterium sp. 26DY04 TaxID=2967130 RepID=UPI0028152291|nr:tRNA dihydrouridine(20/20a) synthase DusA [Pelagibacterium sp. 26DY04]WMT88116.1 tRNA dihydrouridine(20/20a) synthase DusA [Pelagibacterium sp. 26DY04]
MELEQSRKFSVAPMMDWTDRHCRYLHRQLSSRALLFTEMVTSAALVRGDVERLLGYDDSEHPVAVQLGGSDPRELALAVAICDRFGYDEINLNVGCPSDRVQSGKFGACLMAEPDLVAECLKAMRGATDTPVTVKCRIGIDDQDSEADLNRFVDAVIPTGIDALYVHARKAWLKGLSPKENRDIPPLDYDRVYRLKQRLGDFPVMINGGIKTLDECDGHLERVDGVMLGRVAYHEPMILAEVDARYFGETSEPKSLDEIEAAMTAYAERERGKGTRLNQITRHMLGLANGLPGARRFRQILSVEACKQGAGPEVIAAAFAQVRGVSESNVA